MIRHALLLWLVLLSAVALAWPTIAGGAFDPFLATLPRLPLLISLIMFAVGCLLPRDELAQLRHRWRAVAAGTTLQYLSMPILAWTISRALGLSGAQTTGMIIAGCVPGAMASNVLTHLARGNTSYSVSLTTSATLLSPLIVPAALKWFLGADSQANVDFVRESSFLLTTVVLPVAAGHLLARLADRHVVALRGAASLVANLTILWLIASIVAKHRADLDLTDARLIAALLALNVCGYLAGYLGGFGLRLPEPMRRALTLEIGMQNAGLGATLAIQMFPDEPMAAVPPTLYMFGCMFTGAALAQVWGWLGVNESREPV